MAGLGTRSLPASKAIPKEMLPLFDRPIIQVVVEEAVQAGVEDIIFVTSKGKSAIEDHFDISPDLELALEKKGKKELLDRVRKLSRLVNVQSVRQKEALGLGHAVGMASTMVSGSHFFILLGDEVTDAQPTAVEQLMKTYESISSNTPDAGVIMLMEVLDEDVSKYGICEISSSVKNQIVDCLEKPPLSATKSRWAITGRYLLPKEIFSIIEKQGRCELGEIQLTDALQHLAQQGKLYACFFKGRRFDAGDRLGFLEANIHYYLKSQYADSTRKILKDFLK